MPWYDVSEYFSFTKKERKGIFIIMGCILLVIFVPYLFPYFSPPVQIDPGEFAADVALLQNLKTDTSYVSNSYKDENYFSNDYSINAANRSTNSHPQTFYFDPNTASASDWKRLGIKEKTIRTIQNYLSKGGKFYKPEDIGKIWGISPSDAKRLVPYVVIKTRDKQTSTYEKTAYIKPVTLVLKKSIDINLADTTAFKSLPGIGSRLSQRIVNFRNKLGGFYSVDQVGETYLLPDSTFQKIKSLLIAGDFQVRKVDINTDGIDALKSHPYINYNLANAIVQYRQQHGNFTKVDDLKQLMLVSDEVYQKIYPYLSVD